MSTTVHRPIGVSIISIILWVQGLFSILAGVGFLIERNDNDLLSSLDKTSGELTTMAWVLVILGVITVLIGAAMWSGASWARMVVAVIEVLHIAAALYLLFTRWGSYGWNSLAQILVAGIVLFLLFNPRADEFFRQRHSA